MFRSLAEAESFLRTRTDYERRVHPPGWRPDLGPVRDLLSALGNPHRAFRVVHVGGTKGKGSTATFAAELLRAGGKKVGLYTSPHLERLTERIVVDGEEIGGEAFASAIGETAATLEPSGVGEHATFFDLVTAAAFLHFKRSAVEWAVVEVGLGGRLDSTNVVEPEVCALTNVDLEHTEVLGERVEDIAREKAGIVKEGVPVVAGFEEGPALAVLERVCREKSSPLRRKGGDFAVQALEPDASGGLRVSIRTWRSAVYRARLPGPGLFQVENLALAVAAIEGVAERGSLPGFDLAKALEASAERLRVPGRFEVFPGAPTVVLDGAHTPASVEAALRSLEAAFPGRRVEVVFAAQRDKDLVGMLSRLLGRTDTVHATVIDNPRAAPPAAIAAAARGLELDVVEKADPNEALGAAAARAGRGGVVLALGSLYLVGAIRAGLARRGPAERRGA